jgi:lipopolysaccharide/colanic/teichoic acid biosynthesis glycosyltransferase
LTDTSLERSFYESEGKRFLDLSIATVALLLLLPFFLLIAVLVKVTSTGPVFYRQGRVGKAGRCFNIIKFRTMHLDADKNGPSITSAGDPRITALGRMIRTLKLDELPQLWNVLKGEMSLVGPRPEIPSYANSYTEEQRKVLEVRPGITDPASIAYRYEEGLLGRQANPAAYYQEVLLPHKLTLNAEYIRNISLKSDIHLVGKTLWSVFMTRPRPSVDLFPSN